MAQEVIFIKPEVRKIRSKRSSLEIDMAILRVVRVSSRPTKIMDVSRINANVFYARLSFLEKKGLIEEQRIKLRCHSRALSSSPKFSKYKIYNTTRKGIDLVALWLNFQKAYGDLIA